jgi:hypothetical protein
MFSKDEEKALRGAFWSTLTARMQKKRGASGRRLNWFKYPTGLRDIYVRTEVDHTGCRVCIDLQFKHADIRELFFEQFLETKTVFEETMKVPVKWQPKFNHITGKEISRISIENNTTNLFNQDNWAEMHDFIHDGLVSVDTYWNDFGELYKTLQSTN